MLLALKEKNVKKKRDWYSSEKDQVIFLAFTKNYLSRNNDLWYIACKG